MAKRKKRIALLLDYLVSEYTDMLLNGIRHACHKYDFDLYIFPIGSQHDLRVPFSYQYAAVKSFVTEKNLDGIIIHSGPQMHSLSKTELASFVKSFQPLPIINISFDLPGVPSIYVECKDAYKKILNELVFSQGCKRFCIIGVRSNSVEVKNRTKIIKDILEETGISNQDITLIKAEFEYDKTIAEIEEYFKYNENFNFDAVICLSDEIAFAILDFAKKRELRIPEDFVVVGFDNLDRGRYTSPSLTTISQNIFDQGTESVRMLYELIEGEMVPDSYSLQAEPIFRNSTNRKGYSAALKKACTVSTGIDLNSCACLPATEWYSKRSQIQKILTFFTELQGSITVEKLQARINDDIKNVGLKSFGIVLYDAQIEMPTPFDYFNLPRKASVFSAFDLPHGFDSRKSKKNLKFNPNDGILPDGVISGSPDGICIIALFQGTLQYGYMIFDYGSLDFPFCDMLAKFTATIVSSVYEYTVVHKEQTKIHQKYARLGIIANTDELTGLVNRRGLYDKGETTLKFAKAMNNRGIIVYCDMDGLKKINDTYGHEAGDRAIIAESIILRGNFRADDIVARIGGDEFAIICPGLTEEAYQRISSKINDDCRKWTEDNHSPFELSISMGYVCYPSEKVGYQITPLLSEADSSLYIEKRMKKMMRKKSKKN